MTDQTKELIAKIEALAERLAVAAKGARYVGVWPTGDVSPAELAAIATHFGSPIETQSSKFKTRIERAGVCLYVETGYGAVPEPSIDASALLAAACDAQNEGKLQVA